MQIDLRTTIIPKNQKVWVVHAGRQKKFRNNFIELNKVFIDFPGLPFLSEDFPDEDKKIYEAVYEVDARKRAHKGLRSSNDPLFIPKKPSKRHQVMMSYVKRFYRDIAIGDLIVSPARTQYDRLLIGHVRSDVTSKSRVRVKDYMIDRLPGREVNWGSSKITKRDLSTDLAIKMENPQAIIKITDKELLSSLFSEMYGAYIWEDESKLDIHCLKGNNPLDIVPIQELLAFFNAVYYCYEQNELQSLKGKDFYDIANNYFDDAFIIDLSQEFHSPGHFRQRCRDAILVSFLAVALTLASTGNFTSAAIDNLKITNSSSKLDAEQEKHLKSILKGVTNSILPKTLDETNKRGKKAKEDTRMSTPAKLNN